MMRSGLIGIGMLLALIATLLFSGVVIADHSASSSAFKKLAIEDDNFYNWDFESKSARRTNVDWPVTMVFTNGGEVSLVKNMFYGSTWRGVNMHFRLNDGDEGDGWEWDSDKGTKGGGGCATTMYHMRVYGADNDSSYNVSWGYYVLGTTHVDYRECAPGRWHGESQRAEHHFNDMADDAGLTYSEDSVRFYNRESFRQVGRHRVRNDGYATSYDLGVDD